MRSLVGHAGVTVAGTSIRPPEHSCPGRVHEDDPAFIVDRADTFAEAAGDDRQVVLLPLDLRVEVGIRDRDGSDGRQCIEECEVGLIEGLGPAGPDTDSHSRRSANSIGADRVLSSRLRSFGVERHLGRAQEPAGGVEHGCTSASLPLARLTSSVASNRPRSRIRSFRAEKCPSPRYRRTKSGSTASGRNSGWEATRRAVGTAMPNCAGRHQESALHPTRDGLAPRGAQGGQDGGDRPGVDDQVAHGPDQRSPDLDIAVRVVGPVDDDEGQPRRSRQPSPPGRH